MKSGTLTSVVVAVHYKLTTGWTGTSNHGFPNGRHKSGHNNNIRNAEISKLTPPKPVIVVSTGCGDAQTNSKRSGLVSCPGFHSSLLGFCQSSGPRQGWATARTEDGAIASESGLAAYLRASERPKEVVRSGATTDDDSESRMFPSLNAVKLQEERVREEQRLRHEAHRLQQLQKNKEDRLQNAKVPEFSIPSRLSQSKDNLSNF